MRADATAAALDWTQAIVSGRVGIGEASTFSKSTLALEAMAGFGFWAIATAPVSANAINVGQAGSLPHMLSGITRHQGQRLATHRSGGDLVDHVRQLCATLRSDREAIHAIERKRKLQALV